MAGGLVFSTARALAAEGKRPLIVSTSSAVGGEVTVGGDAVGRALLSAAHGRLSATLMVLKSFPAPSQTHTENVQLVRKKPHGRTKK